MDSAGFEPAASPMPRERSSADLRAHTIHYRATENQYRQIKLMDKKHFKRRHRCNHSRMKKKELEMRLQQVPRTDQPNPHLEQYMTPATIASDIIFTAYQLNDIENKTILDLGCGTGIFAIGACLAGAKNVIGIDIDRTSIQTAKTYAQQQNLDIEFLVKDINDVDTSCDTVLMNPPFGAQKSNLQADRKFLEKAFQLSQVIYSIHLKKTIPFIEKLVTALHGDITHQKDYDFPIKWMFSFHTKQTVSYDVTLVRITTKHPP